jgi:hypothetical protein
VAASYQAYLERVLRGGWFRVAGQRCRPRSTRKRVGHRQRPGTGAEHLRGPRRNEAPRPSAGGSGGLADAIGSVVVELAKQRVQDVAEVADAVQGVGAAFDRGPWAWSGASRRRWGCRCC